MSERVPQVSQFGSVDPAPPSKMGAIGDMSVKYILQKHITDSNPEVSESCEVGLDLLAWCNTEEWNETKW